MAFLWPLNQYDIKNDKRKHLLHARCSVIRHPALDGGAQNIQKPKNFCASWNASISDSTARFLITILSSSVKSFRCFKKLSIIDMVHPENSPKYAENSSNAGFAFSRVILFSEF